MNLRDQLYKLRSITDVKVYGQKRWVTEDEGEILYTIIKSIDAQSFIECGTANGYSALWAALALPKEGRVYTFDPVPRPKLWEDLKLGFAELRDKIIYFQEEFQTLKWDPPRPAVVFIDGDHHSESVLKDWRIIEPNLWSFDKVVFHDLKSSKVKRAWDKITERQSNAFIYSTPRVMGVITYERKT